MKIKKAIYPIFIMLFAILFSVKAYAANFNTSISSEEVMQGDTVTVTVTFSSDVTIGAYDMNIEYDANILELEYVGEGDYNGGGGVVKVISDWVNSKSDTRTIIFKAKSAGTATVKAVQLGDVCDPNGNDLTVKTASGTVTVKAPATTSANNNLASLTIMAVRKDGTSGGVTLAPEFTKDVTEYNLWLGSEFNKLVLSAAPEDAKASVATAGTDLKAGDNTTTITVTAENGSKKTYTITTHVKEEETTAEEPKTEPSDEPGTDIEQPTDNEGGKNENRAEIAGKSCIIVDVPEDVKLPEGFERTTVLWNGKEVMGAADLSRVLTLVYAMDEETGEYSFYVYSDSDKSYQPLVVYGITQRSYIILAAEDDFYYKGKAASDSSELELVILDIAGGMTDAYKMKNADNMYIVRAMNWDNKINYYYYNSVEGSMLPYFETALTDRGTTEASGNIISTGERKEFEKRIDKRNILIYIMGAIVVLAAAATVVVFALHMKKKKYNGQEYDGDDDEEIGMQVDDEAEETASDTAGTEETAAAAETEEEELKQADTELAAAVAQLTEEMSGESKTAEAENTEPEAVAAEEKPKEVAEEPEEAELEEAVTEEKPEEAVEAESEAVVTEEKQGAAEEESEAAVTEEKPKEAVEEESEAVAAEEKPETAETESEAVAEEKPEEAVEEESEAVEEESEAVAAEEKPETAEAESEAVAEEKPGAVEEEPEEVTEKEPEEAATEEKQEKAAADAETENGAGSQSAVMQEPQGAMNEEELNSAIDDILGQLSRK